MAGMSSKVYVKKSKHGKGVFAKRDIRKGETILKISGPIVTRRQTKNAKEDYFSQIEPNRYVNARPPGRFINHSCNPNAGLKDSATLVALRKIKKNQEIRDDYSTFMDDDDWTMRCRCGSKKCRGVIKDFKHLPRNIKKKYIMLGIVPKWLLESNASPNKNRHAK